MHDMLQATLEWTTTFTASFADSKCRARRRTTVHDKHVEGRTSRPIDSCRSFGLPPRALTEPNPKPSLLRVAR